MKKKRIDELLVERGFFSNTDEAMRFIIAGRVLINGEVVDKVGEKVSVDSDIEITPKRRYVSRGAEKLLGFFDDYEDLQVEGKICLDVGSSTGGFTQVLLERGAELVYAVDVGKGLIDTSLRNNERVILMEGINARHITPDIFDRKPHLAVIDVSFISLKLIIPPVRDVLSESGEVLALIKPQFEAEPKYLRKGILKEKTELYRVLKEIIIFSEEMGLIPLVLLPSRVRGAKGNREYFLLLREKRGESETVDVDEMVKRAINLGEELENQE